MAANASVSLAVSDNTPYLGETITLTATPTGITPTNYLFFARYGNDLYLIGEQAGGVLNWLVNLSGAFSIFVQADDTTDGVFNVNGTSVTSSGITVNGLQLGLNGNVYPIVGSTYPDFSPFGRDGQLVNSPTVVAGAGGYVEFNGVNQAVESIGSVADFSFIQNTLKFTIGAWVYITDLTGRNPVVSNTPASPEKGFVFYALDTSIVGGGVTKAMVIQITRGVASQALVFKSDNNIITSVGWNYVAFTMNGLGTGQFYLNGQPITTTAAHVGTPALSIGNSTRTISVARQTGYSVFLTGRVAPVYIYNRELSAQEIEDNFDEDKTDYGF
jgi:hypothetical protein